MTIKEKIDNYKAKRAFQEEILSLIRRGYNEENVIMAYCLIEDTEYLKTHPNRNEIITNIAKADDVETAYNAVHITLDKAFINKNILEIVKIIVKSTNVFKSQILKRLNNEAEFWENENHLSILDIILNSSITYQTFLKLLDLRILYREDAKEILSIIANEKSKLKQDIMTSYLASETGEIDFELLGLITEYQSSSRLRSLENNLFYDEQFENKEIRFSIIQTLHHFQNDEKEEAELFSCFDLYNEETDPTIERELGKIYGRILSLSHKEKVKTLQKIGKQL